MLVLIISKMEFTNLKSFCSLKEGYVFCNFLCIPNLFAVCKNTFLNTWFSCYNRKHACVERGHDQHFRTILINYTYKTHLY